MSGDCCNTRSETTTAFPVGNPQAVASPASIMTWPGISEPGGGVRTRYERQRAALHCAFFFRFLAQAIYWSRRGLANVYPTARRARSDALHSSLIGKMVNLRD